MSEEEVFSIIGSRLRAALRDLPFRPSRDDLEVIARSVASVGIALCQRAGLSHEQARGLCDNIYVSDLPTN